MDTTVDDKPGELVVCLQWFDESTEELSLIGLYCGLDAALLHDLDTTEVKGPLVLIVAVSDKDIRFFVADADFSKHELLFGSGFKPQNLKLTIRMPFIIYYTEC